MAGFLNRQVRLYLLLLLGIGSSCNMQDRSNNAKEEIVKTPVISSVQNSFVQIDSVEIIPAKAVNSQKKEQHFFLKDTVFIKTLKNNLALKNVATQECSHDVKLYLYKGGEVYKTVYAALDNSCSYLAFAVNGQPFFVPLTAPFRALLEAIIQQHP